MTVTPTEVFPSDLLSQPNPVYKDKLITVYGIPIFPSVEVKGMPESDLMLTDDPSLKRKRESSPDSPSKRPLHELGLSGLKEHTSLEVLKLEPDFSPISLKGENAQEWRKSVLKTMFPFVAVKKSKRDRDTPWPEKQDRKPGKVDDEPTPNNVRLISVLRFELYLPHICSLSTVATSPNSSNRSRLLILP